MRMPFGKFRDYPLEAVPSEYLVWLVTLPDLREPLRSAVRWEASQRGCRVPDDHDVPPSYSTHAPDPAVAEALITAGLRSLAKRHHPDLGGDTETMQRVNATAEALRASFRVVRRGAA